MSKKREKTHYQWWRSVMAKLDNEIGKKKEEMARERRKSRRGGRDVEAEAQ